MCGLAEDDELLLLGFGWGNGRKIHWASWGRLCAPKKFGGMGCCDLHCFNLAFLGKQATCFITNPNALSSRYFKAKYFSTWDFLDA